MTEQLRNALKRETASSISGDTYSYEAYNQSGEAKTYRFFLNQEKLKLDVYGMTTEPVTGTTSGKEEYALTCEEGAALCQERGRDRLRSPSRSCIARRGDDAFPHEPSLVCRFLQEGAAL